MTMDAPGNAARQQPGFDPFGRVFISYRVSDGREIAAKLSAALWAHGVPVWFDVDDLAPGDLERRLREALRSGLSGGVLLLTPGVAGSRAVEKVELPELLQLEENADFTLVVASALERPDAPGELDYEEPDRILRAQRGEVSRFMQLKLKKPGVLEEIAGALARRRVEVCARADGSPAVLDINTRSRHAGPRPQATLVVRAEPEKGRRELGSAFWHPFASFLAALPGLVESSGFNELRVCGGAHLSVAFALGAALPTTSPCRLTVQDQRGNEWGDEPSCGSFQLVESVQHHGPPGVPAAVLVDLAGLAPQEDVVERFLTDRASSLSGFLRLSPAERAFIAPSAGASVVDDVAARIRSFVAARKTHRLDLMLAMPFPLAVMLGRRLNTLEARLLELGETATGKQYIPAATVASGEGGGPVVQVHGG